MQERRLQRDRLLSDAILLNQDLHHPVVLMGDFNDSPVSVIHSRLRRHFQDAYRTTGRRWGPTFRAGVIPIRLDYIYVSLRMDRLARVASDHLPVLATVEISWP
jgi:endonuclease/exonuclease/phosphatase family metal-dependent hydrolase